MDAPPDDAPIDVPADDPPARPSRVRGALAAAARSVDLRVSAALAAASVLLFVVFTQFWAWDLDVPQGASGDFTLAGMIVKTIEDTGGYLENPRLGWPLGFQLYDLPIGDDNLNLLLMRVISWFTGDFAVIMNVFMILTFPLVAVCAYLATRRMGVTRWPAAMVALLYAFLPYHFRGQVFLLLIGYWALPFGLLLAFRVFQGVPLFTRREGVRGPRSWLTRRTGATVLTCLAMGSTGLYLAAFVVVVLLAAVVVQGVSRRGRRVALGGVAAVVLVMGTVVVNVSPSIVYRMQNGTNGEVAFRGEQESEIYGLTLTRMVLPPQNHRFGPARRFGQHYQGTTNLPLAGEQSSYVGVVSVAAIAGLFVLLLAAATRGVSAARRRRYGPLAAGVVVAFVFGVVGGVNTIFSYAVTPVLRGTGRISVAIAFCALVAAAFFLDGLRTRMERSGRALWAFPGIVAVVTVVGLYDQSGTDLKPAYYDQVKAEFTVSKDFVRRIEAEVPPETAVYQIPEQAFPESPGPVSILDYDSGRPYLHSKRLNWSFGAARERQGRWLLNMLFIDDIPRKLARVSACGFGGLWLDRNGYQSWGPVAAEVARVTGDAPIVSSNGRWEFYSLEAFNRRFRERTTQAERERLCEVALNPLEVVDGRGGVSDVETDGQVNYRMLARDSRVTIRSDLPDTRSVSVEMDVFTTAVQPTPVTVTGPDGASATVNAQAGAPATVRLRTTLPPREGELRVVADLPGEAFPDPGRALRVQRVVLNDTIG